MKQRCGRVVVVMVLMGVCRALSAQPGPGWSGLSPFTDVTLDADAAEVVYQGQKYELVSVQGIATKQILDFCRDGYEKRWEERFATDLPDVMAAMGKKSDGTLALALRDPKTGQMVNVERAAMTRENRAAVRAALLERPWTRLKPEQMRQAVDELEKAIEERWPYREVNPFDHRPMLKAIRQRINAGATIGEFLGEMQKVIGRGIDAHASVEGWERFAARGSLPFLVEPVGNRFVAFWPDRKGFIEQRLPYIESIDDRPIKEWIEAASAYIPDGSPQYVRQRGLRTLRSIQFLRKEMGLPQADVVEVGLASADGKERKAVRLSVVKEIPNYGIWPPQGRQAKTPVGIAYLRLADMDEDPVARKVITTALSVANQSGAKGLIIDVRDNGGGARDSLRHVAAAVMQRDAKPRVVNAAVYRVHPDHGRQMMESRFLYPENWQGWTDAQRRAIAEFRKGFEPQWTPPAKGYSEWHYMVLRAGEENEVRFDGPVVVLMNSKCFSATDVFLSGLKGMANVTLVGTPSAGGSANVNKVTLGTAPLEVSLGTMVSFQADGKLFDGHGVAPDVHLEPEPEFFIGGRDNQLEEAAKIIEEKRQGR